MSRGHQQRGSAGTAAGTTRTLDRLPDTRVLLAKGALSLTGRRAGAPAGLPDRALAVAEVQQDLDRYTEYSRICGRGLRDEVLPTWLHVLTFGLQLDLLTQRDFPFPAVGLIHVANRMHLHRPVRVTEELSLSVHAADLRPHRSGAQFDIREQVHVGEELVWEGASTYLARGVKLPDAEASGQAGGDTETETAEGADLPAEPGALPQRALWRVDGRLIRAYAGASGDYNPIHLNPLLAKVFGFPRTIAHGMWSHARALAALESRLPDAYRTRIEFKKPLLLPGTVAFRSRRQSDVAGEAGAADRDVWQFAVTSRDGSRNHLIGVVESP